jgi:hypothetical protein
MRRSDGVVAPCNRLGRQAGYIARDFPRRQRASPARFASLLHGQGRSVAEVHQYPHRDLRQDPAFDGRVRRILSRAFVQESPQFAQRAVQIDFQSSLGIAGQGCGFAQGALLDDEVPHGLALLFRQSRDGGRQANEPVGNFHIPFRVGRLVGMVLVFGRCMNFAASAPTDRAQDIDGAALGDDREPAAEGSAWVVSVPGAMDGQEGVLDDVVNKVAGHSVPTRDRLDEADAVAQESLVGRPIPCLGRDHPGRPLTVGLMAGFALLRGQNRPSDHGEFGRSPSCFTRPRFGAKHAPWQALAGDHVSVRELRSVTAFPWV